MLVQIIRDPQYDSVSGSLQLAKIYLPGQTGFFGVYDPSISNDKLYGFIDPAGDRFKAIEQEEAQDEFKNALPSFVRLYSFLSQILPFQDIELEKLCSFGRFLLSKLPKSDYTEPLKLDNEVALGYSRLQK